MAAARAHMRFMAALCAAGKAALHETSSQMPPLSRPVYATLLSGLPPFAHGILRNEDARPLGGRNVFAALTSAGYIVAAAAYAWFYELCSGETFDPMRHRILFDSGGPIAHGIFYENDAYPDDALFADAEWLRRSCAPDFLLAHSMGIDCAGHAQGGQSAAYYAAASRADALLARYLPHWLSDGYAAIVLSDHGMDANGAHYSTEDCVMRVPVWLAGANWPVFDSFGQTDIPRIIAARFGLGFP